MQKILTPVLLNAIRALGYHYFLSRTTCIIGADADLRITLLPVKYEPDITALPENFDTYFDIMEEPVLLAEGVDQTIVVVDLTAVNRAAKGRLSV